MSGGRALDHLVLPCPDLAAAVQQFEALGFLVGRRNRHPWGTENHIIQLPGAFLELIALAPDAAPVAPDDDAFAFAGFLAGEGIGQAPSGMIVLRTLDAAADAEAFVRDGIGTHRTLQFARSGTAPDGSVRTVAFSLAFAEAPLMPDVGFFVCHHLHPENFWSPALQRHPNGVTGLASVTIAAEQPEVHADFLGRFVGAPVVATPNGLAVDLGASTTLLVAAAPGLPRLASLRFRTPRPRPAARFGGLELRFDGGGPGS